jgi:glycosyltransferase involved in cell wall biosynthesis
MHVLFIGPLPDPVTGQSLACQVFLDELRRHHTVEVVNLSKKTFDQGMDSLQRVREILGIGLHVARTQRYADVVYLTTAESVAGNLKDLVLLALCGRRLSSVAIHLHGGAGMRELMRPGRWLRALNAPFLRRLGAVVVLGERHIDIFSDFVDREHMAIVPNFAQDELFVDDDAITARFGALRAGGDARLRLLFLSNLLPGKGHEELVAGLKLLPPETQARIELDVAGAFPSDEDRTAFEASVASLAHVTIHGIVRGEAKRRLLQEAHMFCLPTYYPYEGQPISILEAFAAGCAVLTTDHSGILDVFDPGEGGFAVEKRSPGAIRNALAAALAAPERLEAMGLHNARSARERFRTGRYNERLLSVIDRLAGRGGATRT